MSVAVEKLISGFSFSEDKLLKAIPPMGQLQDLPARRLVDYLNRNSFSGTLVLRHREKKKKLWFAKGEVFRIQSNLVPELIGRMMVDRGWLNEADLKSCLKVQQDLLEKGAASKRIGELASEVFGIDEDEIACLIDQQSISTFLQATTWDSGDFELTPFELRNEPKPLFKFEDIIGSLQSLFEVSPTRAGPLFEQIETWHPDSQQSDLSRMPLWGILAGCRRLGLSGILSVRRQNKLYEIVLKYGVPLTLYEGSFGQPRQTIVVRQASDEHERFFIEQLFKLFSFLTGSVYFRSLSDAAPATKDSDSHLQFREETAVTKSVRADELGFELHPDFLMQKSFWKFLLQKLQKHFDSAVVYLRRLVRF